MALITNDFETVSLKAELIQCHLSFPTLKRNNNNPCNIDTVPFVSGGNRLRMIHCKVSSDYVCKHLRNYNITSFNVLLTKISFISVTLLSKLVWASAGNQNVISVSFISGIKRTGCLVKGHLSLSDVPNATISRWRGRFQFFMLTIPIDKILSNAVMLQCCSIVLFNHLASGHD